MAKNSEKELWLKLFKADTEQELEKIEALEVPIMSEAIRAYRHVAASPEFREIERVRSRARHDEAQAIRNAERRRDKHWQGIADENERLRQELAELRSRLDEQYYPEQSS